MSNTTNLHKCLLRIPLNQSITVSVFLHWFKPTASRMFLFVVSKIALLIRPNSFFAGFMSLIVGLLLKFSLWSFRVIKLLFSPLTSNRFSISLFFKIFFPSTLICFLCCYWLFCISRLWCCLSYDRIPLLLIGKDLFCRRKWLSNANMLNKRTEILNKCRHKNKYALISYDSKD